MHVDDGRGGTADQIYTLTAGGGVSAPVPVITSTPSSVAVVAAEYAYQPAVQRP